MTRPVVLAGLPLLRKELLEQSARKRTYVFRVVYAVLLFAFFILFFAALANAFPARQGSLLGVGRWLLGGVANFQFYAVCLLLPGIVASALPAERERGSFTLLVLTGLGPTTILAEKFLSRLVPMFTCLLLSLPLMAFAFAHGGFTTERLWAAVFLLFLTCVQVGAFALLVSTFFETVVRAVVVTYAVGLALSFLAPVSYWMSGFWAFAVFPPVLYAVTDTLPLHEVVARSWPCVGVTIGFLVLARLVFGRRLMEAVARGERTESRRPARTGRRGGGAARARSRRDRFVFAIGAFAYIVALGVALWQLQEQFWRSSEAIPLQLLVGFLWCLAALIVTVEGASAIVTERTRGTLEVLLTTPLTGREIIKERMRRLRWLVALFGGAILLTCLFEAAFEHDRKHGIGPGLYLLGTLLAVTINLGSFAYLGLRISLQTRTTTRAIITSLALLAAWVALPFFAAGSCALSGTGETSFVFAFFSPAMAIGCLEVGEVPLGEAWIVLLINFVIHGFALVFLRSVSLGDVDLLLGRVVPPGPSEVDFPT